MGVSTEVVVKACERVFARVCEVGRDVPPDTPAAGFLAAAARNVDEAQARLEVLRDPEEIGAVLVPLRRAGALLGDVQRMDHGPLESLGSLDRISVIVDGICVTLEIDKRQELRARGQDGLGKGPAQA